jgi:hypothetical protein
MSHVTGGSSPPSSSPRVKSEPAYIIPAWLMFGSGGASMEPEPGSSLTTRTPIAAVIGMFSKMASEAASRSVVIVGLLGDYG